MFVFGDGYSPSFYNFSDFVDSRLNAGILGGVFAIRSLCFLACSSSSGTSFCEELILMIGP